MMQQRQCVRVWGEGHLGGLCESKEINLGSFLCTSLRGASRSLAEVGRNLLVPAKGDTAELESCIPLLSGEEESQAYVCLVNSSHKKANASHFLN